MHRFSTHRTFSRHHVLLTAVFSTAVALSASAQTIFGLTPAGTSASNTLVTFTGIDPNTILDRVSIAGVTGGQTLVGLDVRPATNELYALGYDAGTQTGQLYVMEPATGQARAVGSGPVPMALGGPTARIGFDFNPTADRIRVVSSLTQANLRLHPTTGAVVATDGRLAYAPTDANAGQTPAVGAVAYSNAYIGATTTTLYALDETANRLLTQNPPNNGTLNTVGAVDIRLSGNGQVVDFDAYFNPMTLVNYAYLSVATPGIAGGYGTQLHVLNLTSGATFLSGTVGDGRIGLSDIAVQTARPDPLPALVGPLVYALAGTNLLTFDSTNPGLIRTATVISGLDPAQTLVGLDVRPATNSLYALGYSADAQTATLYTLHAATGAAQAINATPVALALGTGSFGFDFNPVTDQIRVTGANRANFRLNPTDGTATADGLLTYAPGDANAANSPAIGAIAHTNSAAGATSTKLFAYDEVRNVLARQSAPNTGALSTVGGSSLSATVLRDVDLDIYSTSSTTQGYLVANTAPNGNSIFYTLNVATGLATPVGVVGNGLVMRDIAVASAAGVTGVRGPALLTALSLYPNPVRREAAVEFTLPRAGHVQLTVTDMLGRTIDTLDAGTLAAGRQQLQWHSQEHAAGTYFFRLSLDGRPAGTRRGTVVR
ncbi:DUF4394 domain-containing protein [Hymenobacter psychrotolerans]|uniref:Por secretion system C-terminal sorting domain-containing protein n=1 Tax=Hymenobacter psychrotolerans DSM 18569 TaxID=1121959 RepID=A0A1M6WJ53_9BACT|nr:DUF4394 domain-containing protein [Hymenobacter psychrotolerans]SHK93823.1 Por secretion system C-terminal sorting domain-containing protein [Hymenobacter psychrotolerans DSM 18569]